MPEAVRAGIVAMVQAAMSENKGYDRLRRPNTGTCLRLAQPEMSAGR